MKPRVVYAHPAGQEKAQVLDFLASQAITLETAALVGDDGYYQLLRQLWAQAQPFVLVEWDVLPYPGAIEEIWACEQAFCGKPYQIRDLLVACLGCSKISRQLMLDYPGVVEEAGLRPYPSGPDGGYRHWASLDSRLFAALYDAGHAGDLNAGYPHQHFPPVDHLHQYPYWPTPQPMPALNPRAPSWAGLELAGQTSLVFDFGQPLTVDGRPAHQLLEATAFSLEGSEPALFVVPEQRGPTLGRVFCQLLGDQAPRRLRAVVQLADARQLLSTPLELAS